MRSTSTIQAEFDRIAQFDRERWDHNNHYHDYLLRHMPASCANALDIGCGTGAFARLLAGRSQHVLGIDLSPEMLRLARERSATYANADYQQRDFMMWDVPAESFDCIASIATLHHLPLEAALNKIKQALKPGGVLLVLDLYQGGDAGALWRTLVSVPMHALYDRVKNGGVPASAEERAAWDEHGAGDVYLPIREIRRLCAAVLPGADVRQQLLWRYSIIWTKS